MTQEDQEITSSKKLTICLALPTIFDPKMPSRPAITEIYGKYLPALGHRIIWLSPSNDINKIEKKIFQGALVYIIPSRISLCWPMRVKYFFQYRYLEFKQMMAILKYDKCDIIQVRNDIFSSILALAAKKMYGVLFVFQYSFPINDNSFKIKAISLNNLNSFSIFCILRLLILPNADLILPISKWMKCDLVKQGIPESKMVSLPMGINPDLFSAKSSSTIKQRYDLGGKRIILYIGTLDRHRQLSILLHSFQNVLRSMTNVKLLLVGDGNSKKNLKQLAEKLQIAHEVVFTGCVPYSEIPNYIDAADICLSIIPPLEMFKVSSPTKLFEYMAMGKPVIANEEIPEQKEVITAGNGGVLVKFDAKSISTAIIELLNNPNDAESMGLNGRSWVLTHRSYEKMANCLENRYFELLSPS